MELSDEGPVFCAQPVLAAQLTNELPDRWADLELEAEDEAWAGRLGPGGHYRPHGCQASTRVAILIPLVQGILG